MKKTLLAVLTTMLLSGCGEAPSQEEAAFKQQKEMLLIQQAHQREMARIEAQKIEAANQVSHTYVENEYESDISPEYDRIAEYGQPSHYQETDVEYSTDSYSDYQQPVPDNVGTYSANNASVESSGFSGGDMALAVAGAAVAGYAVNELLDSGHRSGVGSDGVTRYYDGKGTEITKSQYNDYKAKHPVKSKARELTNKGRDKAAQAGTAVKQQSKKVGQKVAESKVGKTAQKGYVKAKKSAKKVAGKVKSKYKQQKHKQQSRSKPSRGRR